MNKVMLIGRLTKDPEVRTTSTGLTNARFTLAVDRPFVSQDKERGTDFISCIVWRKQAENVGKYCTKGMQVAVEGRIQTGSFDAQDGTKRYTTDVVCDSVQFLGSKSNNGPVNDNPFVEDSNPFGQNEKEPEKTTDISEDPYKDFGSEVVLSDDDLPF